MIYRVIGQYTQYYEAFIEANTEDEANQLAQHMDANAFEPLQEVDTWEIADIFERGEG